MIKDSELARNFESKNHRKFKQIATELWQNDAIGKEYHS